MRTWLLALAAACPAAAWGAEIPVPKVGFGGQIRARAETTNLQGYATPGVRRGQDQYLLRTRLHADADAGNGLKAFLQLQDSRTSGTEASVAANSANVDLHQGYMDVLDLFGKPLDLRAGRMELQYGDGRLVNPLDWSNIGRAWDGLRLRLRAGERTLDAFATKVKETADLKRDQVFWGVYGTCRAVPRHEFDLYVLGREFGDGTQLSEHGKLGNLSDRTFGTRFKGTPGAWDYTGELAWQAGRKAAQRVRAWGTAWTGGYTFEAAWKPRAGVEYDFASGDSDPSDNKVQTFDPLFPFGHAYQGYQDIFSWKNGHAFKGSLSVDPEPGWRVQSDVHHFRLAHTRDGWYDGALATIARDATGASGREIGTEVDLHVRGKFRDVLGLWFGYSHFFAGQFVRNTTARRDRDWAFFQATLGF